MLSSEDIELLQVLQADPLKSYSALSETLGKAAQTVKKHYLNLESRFPESFSVKGNIFYSRLQLDFVDVYIALKSISFIELIEKALRNHEYIKFTARCIGIGANSGIYAQFTIPQNTIHLLEEYLEIFQKHGYVDNFEIRKHSINSFTKLPELDAWKADEHRWGVSSNEITQRFEEISNQPKVLEELQIPDYDLNQLDKTKLIILEELSSNARRSDRQMYRERQKIDQQESQRMRSSLKLDVSFSTFSRAMNAIDPLRTEKQGYANLRKQEYKDKFGLISGYQLHYSARMFSIFDTCIFKGRVSYDWKLHQLYNLIYDKHPFKFRMSFMIYETGDFAWYNPIPSQFLNAFTKGLTKYVTHDFEVIWINYGSTHNFTFWPENFDLDKKKWKDDRNWMITTPKNRFLELEKQFPHFST